MNIPFPPEQVLLTSIAIAAALVYVPFFVVGAARINAKVDLNNPRAEQDKLPPYAQRAYAAHQNSFEVFMLFAAAALMVYTTGKASNYTSIVSIVFLVARLFHSIFYIANVLPLRGLMWATSIGCVASLMGTSLTIFNTKPGV
jgi:uncharacterized MAPEG superfamily protein